MVDFMTTTRYVDFGIPTTSVPRATQEISRRIGPTKSLNEVFTEALRNRADIGEERDTSKIIEFLRQRWNDEQGKVPGQNGLSTIDVLVRAVKEYDLQLKDLESSLRGS